MGSLLVRLHPFDIITLTHTHSGLYVCVTGHVMTEATVSLPRTMFAFHRAQGVDAEVGFFHHKNTFLSLSLNLLLSQSRSIGSAEACHTEAKRDSLDLHSGNDAGSLEHCSFILHW